MDKSQIEVTLLDREYIEEKTRSETFKKIGILSEPTDFALLLGISGVCHASDIYIFHPAKNPYNLKSSCEYYTKSKGRCGDVAIINDNYALDNYDSKYDYSIYENADMESCLFIYNRELGIRPVIPASALESYPSTIDEKGVKTVEYGEYPQTVVDHDTSIILEKLYRRKRLDDTGKEYVTNVPYPQNRSGFEERKFLEYEYNGKKYIRVGVNSLYHKLSNGEKPEKGKFCWVEVEPIKWKIINEAGIAVSDKTLISGISLFDNTVRENYNGNFESTMLYRYLNKQFIKDIIPSKIVDIPKQYNTKKGIFQILKERLIGQKNPNDDLDSGKIAFHNDEWVELDLLMLKVKEEDVSRFMTIYEFVKSYYEANYYVLNSKKDSPVERLRYRHMFDDLINALKTYTDNLDKESTINKR